MLTETMEDFEILSEGEVFLKLWFVFIVYLSISDDITDIAGMFTDDNSDSNNFTPFTSKAEALVYMMINSPHPLVS